MSDPIPGTSKGKHPYRDPVAFEDEDDSDYPLGSRPISPEVYAGTVPPPNPFTQPNPPPTSSYVFPSHSSAFVPQPDPTAQGQARVYPRNLPPVLTRPGTARDLPARGHKEAPEKFKGKYSEIEHFLDHYEKLLNKYNVHDSKEKCKGILEYISISVR